MTSNPDAPSLLAILELAIHKLKEAEAQGEQASLETLFDAVPTKPSNGAASDFPLVSHVGANGAWRWSMKLKSGTHPVYGKPSSRRIRLAAAQLHHAAANLDAGVDFVGSQQSGLSEDDAGAIVLAAVAAGFGVEAAETWIRRYHSRRERRRQRAGAAS